jgi:hypothetical protein
LAEILEKGSMNTTRIIHRVITETPVSLSIKIDKMNTDTNPRPKP